MTVGLARKLSRTKPHRDALLKNLVSQLFQHGTITSTHEKCKEASRLAERVITWAKKANSASVNSVSYKKYIGEIQSKLFLSGDNRHLLNTLLNDIAPRCAERQGGYTRVLHLEPRENDSARESILELVDTPVILDDGSVNKGNLKFWLLSKNTINDEMEDKEYSSLSLKNLQKLSKFKDKEQFKVDLLAVRRLIKSQLNIPWDEPTETTQVDNLIQQVYKKQIFVKPNKYKERGFQKLSQRPDRSTTV